MAERVWERFLTEQDKATLTGRAERRIGFGERPALLLIDLYRWVFGDKPEAVVEAIKTWPGSCGLAGWNALPHIQKLLAKAREVGIPVIHVTGMDGVAIEPWAFRRDKTKRADMNQEQLDRQRRKFEIVDEVKPIPGETVLKKVSPSAFWGTPLIAHLNFFGRRYRADLRRKHQRLCTRQCCRWHDEPLAYDRCRRMRLRPARSLSRHQSLRYEPEIRRRSAVG